MKRLLCQILLFFFFATFISSCSCSSNEQESNEQESNEQESEERESEERESKEKEESSLEKQKDLYYGYESYQEACREGDFAAAHKFLDDYWSPEAETYIFTKEIVYLFGTNLPENRRKAFFLLEETKMIGSDYQDGENLKIFHSDFQSLQGHIGSIIRYNSYCDKIVNLSIQTNDKELALKAANLMKEQTFYKLLYDNADGYYDYDEYSISHSNDAKDNAISRIKKAFR